MHLEAARRLKQQIRAALSPSRIALGIDLAETGDGHRVAILLRDDEERRFLESPRVRSVIRAAGGEVAVEVLGEGRARSASSTQMSGGATLRIGVSVGHHRGGVGSLGFFAARKSDGKRGFVSCNHVIAMADEGQDGDAIVSPSTLDGAAEVVASLDGAYPRLGAGRRAPADCAFAVLAGGVPYDAAAVDGGMLAPEPAQITRDLAVTKVGRLTNARPGVIRRIEVENVWVRYGTIRVAFDDVILVGSANGERFCEHGDSGALVYTADTFRPVGLLFAASAVGGPHDAGWTWVHPIRHVAEALQVELVTA